jgi:ABC-type nitrate/sulfonate/bicarbonate transport system permease component
VDLKRIAKRSFHFLKKFYSVFVLLLIWDLAARSPWVNQYVFPPASRIIIHWFSFIQSGNALIPSALTVFRALSGLLLAIVCGIFLGLMMGRYRFSEWFFRPLFSIGFPVPKIALLPLFMHWFGLFNQCKIAMVFVDCLFPIVVYTYHGVKGVSVEMVWSALSKGVKGPKLIWKVLLPHAMPQIYDGVQLGIVISLLIAFVAEMVSGGGGLGHLMISAFRYMDTLEAFASLIMIALIGFLFTKLAGFVRSKILFWHIES